MNRQFGLLNSRIEDMRTDLKERLRDTNRRVDEILPPAPAEMRAGEREPAGARAATGDRHRAAAGGGSGPGAGGLTRGRSRPWRSQRYHAVERLRKLGAENREPRAALEYERRMRTAEIAAAERPCRGRKTPALRQDRGVEVGEVDLLHGRPVTRYIARRPVRLQRAHPVGCPASPWTDAWRSVRTPPTWD